MTARRAATTCARISGSPSDVGAVHGESGDPPARTRTKPGWGPSRGRGRRGRVPWPAWRCLTSLGEPLADLQCGDDDVDGLDADEGGDEAADPVDEHVAAQHRRGPQGPELHAAQGERDQADD